MAELPVVAAGLAAVVGVAGRGLYAMYKGDKRVSYRMMRYRVLFQFGTVLALIYSMYYRTTTRKDPSEGKRLTVDKRYYLDTSFEYHGKPEDVKLGPVQLRAVRSVEGSAPYPEKGEEADE